ncbi:hypothetical protein ACLMAL_33565 [Nocardia sp. CWNU-33]|uniref:hypothetical protein n=1 Tax=Nocardia sp. CWNU-33 TaxID=3392117 RepID=UPI00398F0A48
MSTAISDISTIGAAGAVESAQGRADVDLGFDSVPRVQRPHRGAVRVFDSAQRSVADRRPRGNRPRGTLALYERRVRKTPSVRQARGPHPAEMVEQAQVGFAVLAVAALLSALVVTALIGLAHLRAGAFDKGGPTAVPAVFEQGVDGQLVPDVAGAGVPR